MLYYFLLILSSFLFGAQFMAVKAYEKTNGQSVQSSAKFCMIYSVFACFIFLCAAGFQLSFSAFSIILAVALACVGIGSNILGLKTLAMGDIAAYSLFMMLGGMMIPFLYGVIFLHEKIGVWNIIGLVLLVVALVLPVFEKKNKKGKVLFYVLCIGLFVLNGLSSTISKMHQIDERAIPSADFTCLLFAAQAGLGLLIWAGTKLFSLKRSAKLRAPAVNALPLPEVVEDTEKTREEIKKEKCKKILGTVLCSLAFAGLNGTATFLQVLSAKYVAATSQFPIITGGTLVFSAVLGWLIYKEKLSKLKIAQIGVAFAATILFII